MYLVKYFHTNSKMIKKNLLVLMKKLILTFFFQKFELELIGTRSQCYMFNNGVIVHIIIMGRKSL